ncbi:MAG TPA: AAA family ATPase [Solirubrobacteraceae bacterium]|nr:AAA family ATPase [Solirubrobacteraceae bacterium]
MSTFDLDSADGASSNPAFLEELRLKRFKSFRDAVLPLGDLTLLIGRNGSGKSNALEALETLALLAQGEDIRDSIDGSRLTGTAIRGGVSGCAPYGETSFEIGCTVRLDKEFLHFDVEIQTEPDVQILSERLVLEAHRGFRDLLITDPPHPDRADITARYNSGRQGKNPPETFRASRLLITQVGARVPTATKWMRAVHWYAEAIVAALRAVFVLDPVPTLMRGYVPVKDSVLRRDADNISAVVARLRQDEVVWESLQDLIRSLPEQPIDDITIEKSTLDDVIIALREHLGSGSYPVSARLMSDGMLRFIAFAAALLEAPLVDAAAAEAQTMLVIEELENGLHPSQAARVVRLIKAEAARRRIRALATTHSPAMLTALDREDHPYVIVCDRDPDGGGSRLRRLTDLPGYLRALAQGSLGDAVTKDRLAIEPPAPGENDLDRLLAEL